jgi:hypothetical protein
MPIFAPKSLISKAGYGMAWGFYSFWTYVRSTVGLIGGAQKAKANILAGNIGNVTTDPEFASDGVSWNQTFLSAIQTANSFNPTSYYLQYAGNESIDTNQSWALSIFIVDDNGSVIISTFTAEWDASVQNMSLSIGPPTIGITPYYVCAVTLDTANVANMLVTESQIDWAKLSNYAVNTFVYGNVVMWQAR